MKQERERCQYAIYCAKEGKETVLVCSGDSGVYGMASLVYELAEESVQIQVISGVTAANSGAACLGAPLSHDFAVISLSDCNPSSRLRAGYLNKACEIVEKAQSPDTVCGYVKISDGTDRKRAFFL